MFDFDHDAAMRRGAERQHVVERELRTLFDLMDRSVSPTPARELYLVMELFKQLRGSDWKIPDRTLRDTELYSSIPAAAHVAERHLARVAKSDAEYNQMLLDLAKKLLDSATTRIASEFGMWESKTFREKVEG